MKQQNREGFVKVKHSLWGKAEMSFNKLIKRPLARFIAGVCISAFFFMSIVAVLLPINASYAQTKNISVTTENHVKRRISTLIAICTYDIFLLCQTSEQFALKLSTCLLSVQFC